VIELIKPRLAERYPRIPPQRLREEVQRSRDNGYALLLDVVVEQMGGVAVPIFGADGRPLRRPQHRGAERPHPLAPAHAGEGPAAGKPASCPPTNRSWRAA
jgi:hypothetical protein